MPVIKKFNISFVLLLALLFSYSFAGSITFNGDTYSAEYLNSDYTVNSDFSDYTLMYYYDYYYTNKYCYVLTILDDNSVNDNLSVFGAWDYDGYSDKPAIKALSEVSSDYYDSVPSCLSAVRFFFCTDGTIRYSRKNGTISLSSSNFPYNVSNNDFWTYSVASDFAVSQSNVPVDILYSFLDVYSYDSSNHTLGSLVYDSSHNGGGRYFFASSQTQQEINDNTLALLNSSVLPDNLPSTYTNYYMVYDENREIYYGFFFPKAITPTGYIYQRDAGVYYQVEFPFNSYFGYRVYWFYYNGSEYSLVNNFDPFDFTSIFWDFANQPVVYSNFDFPFYSVVDGVTSSEPEFILHYTDITDSNGNIITSSDVLGTTKSDNNIWSMLFSIFNPPSTSDMASIEAAHEDINSKANFGEFYSYYTRNTSFFSDLAAVRWLILADNALYAHFAGFLVMCCFFITLSRIINS